MQKEDYITLSEESRSAKSLTFRSKDHSYSSVTNFPMQARLVGGKYSSQEIKKIPQTQSESKYIEPFITVQTSDESFAEKTVQKNEISDPENSILTEKNMNTERSELDSESRDINYRQIFDKIRLSNSPIRPRPKKNLELPTKPTKENTKHSDKTPKDPKELPQKNESKKLENNLNLDENDPIMYYKTLYLNSEKHIEELRKQNEIEKRDLIYQYKQNINKANVQLQQSLNNQDLLEHELLKTSEKLKFCQKTQIEEQNDKELKIHEYKDLVYALKERLEEVYSFEVKNKNLTQNLENQTENVSDTQKIEILESRLKFTVKKIIEIFAVLMVCEKDGVKRDKNSQSLLETGLIDFAEDSDFIKKSDDFEYVDIVTYVKESCLNFFDDFSEIIGQLKLDQNLSKIVENYKTKNNLKTLTDIPLCNESFDFEQTNSIKKSIFDDFKPDKFFQFEDTDFKEDKREANESGFKKNPKMQELSDYRLEPRFTDDDKENQPNLQSILDIEFSDKNLPESHSKINLDDSIKIDITKVATNSESVIDFSKQSSANFAAEKLKDVFKPKILKNTKNNTQNDLKISIAKTEKNSRFCNNKIESNSNEKTKIKKANSVKNGPILDDQKLSETADFMTYTQRCLEKNLCENMQGLSSYLIDSFEVTDNELEMAFKSSKQVKKH